MLCAVPLFGGESDNVVRLHEVGIHGRTHTKVKKHFLDMLSLFTRRAEETGPADRAAEAMVPPEAPTCFLQRLMRRQWVIVHSFRGWLLGWIAGSLMRTEGAVASGV
jgi:hypothetical protein